MEGTRYRGKSGSPAGHDGSVAGRSSVPQIFINGTHVGGSDELFELDVRGELDKLLGRTPRAN